ncbi:MAG: bifunctional diguanylate cyclase/phosphodiesterase [Acidobacteriota bacterium]|nr:bifunctional diguanylate cyclase/phosphodiesterase [Acidobacteriota bacterium]
MSLQDTVSAEEESRWRELRGALVDHNTELPSLTAVLSEIRELVQNRRRLGLLYLDLSAEAPLESIYGWETYDGLLRQVAEALGVFQRDRLSSDDVLAICNVRGEEFVLVVGLDDAASAAQRLEELQERIADHLSARLRVQFDNESPRPLSVQSAADLLLPDPMVRLERVFYRTLDTLRSICRREREKQHSERIRELRRIVSAVDITVRFQPIISLDSGEVHGFEALSCGPTGGVFENPEMLFAFAEETDHIVELERICRFESIRRAGELGNSGRLFLNCSARGFTDPELFCRNLVDQAERCGLRPADIVIEITERVAITAWQDFRRSVAALRLIGFQIALDDMGAGYSSLQSVAEVQPDYLKVDLSLIRDLHKSPIKRSLLQSLLTIAHSIGAQVIAEGVEKAEECQVLREMNVTFAQGFFFARPTVDPNSITLRLS